MKRVRTLVTGATGYVGSRLVTELLTEGHEVVAASRNPDRLADFGWQDRVNAVALDAHDEASVRSAFADAGPIDVVYYLVHGIGQPDFREADNRAAATVAKAAKDAGVRRIVYLGGFVPDGDELSEHLASRAEVAEALHVDGGPDVVWLGAAIIIGAGSTSFEMLRYVGDRFLVIPMPSWSANPIDPISICDVLHYLVAAADGEQVPAGAYDITGPETTSYAELLRTYARIAGKWRAELPVNGVDTGLVSWVTAAVLPVPGGLAADLVQSLDHPMIASDTRLREFVPDPPAGLIGVEEAITRALASRRRRPVDELTDPHHLADTDPAWAGGDTLRLQQVAGAVTPSIARPALGLIGGVPGPVAGAVRTGVDTLLHFVPKVVPT
ncbi:NAD-dependent epimerase [Mycolicibacterium novocastrense]|uniref:NAD(P)H-binding protein n=1 Tax=Mycolicibacterium novocastrense TaxID=59813 RepID=UPI00074A83FC|nr:NAD(P)H-binding protein [Mycolicibacterium novocastrense]KUH76675.1 NAD-dependent epimerase [Mycolicibacterium novocastrense]KUH77995.1 NAD-dependent epimerase [Mycolicibacterium novocastrense]KUH79329.1 NAD-dependent epimerase [Mycolicibacterium novocastrense]